MNYTYVLGIIGLLGGLLSPVLALPASAAESPGVVLSEINWGGSGRTPADEWLELANLGGGAVDVGGWTIGGAATSGGALAIAPGTVIPAYGTLLIANYTVGASSTLAVVPDLVTSAVSLPNTKLELHLFMADGTLVDSLVDAGTPDFGSTTPVFASMERDLGTLLWHSATTSQNLLDTTQLGTPGIAAILLPVVEVIIAPETVVEEPTVIELVTEAVPEVAPEVTEAPSEPMATTPPLMEGTGEVVAIDNATPSVEEIVDVPVDAPAAEATSEVIVEVAPAPDFVLDTVHETIEIAEVAEPPAAEEIVVSSSPSVTAASMSSIATTGQVVLNELFAAPTDEAAEWVELVNRDTITIDIGAWHLRDASGKFTALSGTLEAGAYLVVENPSGKLNNTSETVELLDALGNVVDRVAYGTDVFPAPKHDESISRQDDTWFVTTTATRGATNAPIPVPVTAGVAVTVTPVVISEQIVTPADSPVTGGETEVTYHVVGTATAPTTTKKTAPKTAIAKAKTTKAKKSAAPTHVTSIDGVADGKIVQYEGTILAAPGTFGSQIAVMNGVILYLDDANWPALSIGDVVTLTGTMSTAHGERRIKLKNAAALTVTGHSTVTASNYSATSATPSLVTVRGVVVTRQGSTLTLLANGEEVTIEAGKHTGISWSALSSSTLTVTGVLRRIDGKLVLMPRSITDVVVEAPAVVSAAVVSTPHNTFPTKPVVGGGMFTGALGALGYWFIKSRTLIPSA